MNFDEFLEEYFTPLVTILSVTLLAVLAGFLIDSTLPPYIISGLTGFLVAATVELYKEIRLYKHFSNQEMRAMRHLVTSIYERRLQALEKELADYKSKSKKFG